MDGNSRRSLFANGRMCSAGTLPFSPPPCPVVAEPANFIPFSSVHMTRRRNSANAINMLPSATQCQEGPHTQLGNVTVKLAEVYHGCDPSFHYDRSGNPRRI